MNTPLLAINNLTVDFLTDHVPVRAVDGVSFVVEQQKCVGIIGESGSGKTTIAHSILRLVEDCHISGQILFLGQDLLKIPISKMQKIRGQQIAMVFQDTATSLNPVLRVGWQVAESICFHQKLRRSEAIEKAVELFIKVGIPSAEKRIYAYPHELSGGQRQRVLIAMALACQPKLLIADEPTSALDLPTQIQILTLLRQIQQQYGMSLLLISHDLQMVTCFCDNVLVLHKGQVNGNSCQNRGTNKNLFCW